MGIIIKEVDDEYWLYKLSFTPVVSNLFKPAEPFWMLYSVGKIRELGDFELDKEYNLNVDTDFEISERIPISIDIGTHDDLYYKLK